MLADQLHDQSTSCGAQPQPRGARGRRSARRSRSGRGRPAPCRCRAAARPASSRSGRSTSRSSPVARTTVSTRCRSTVCRWTALRCGRVRTAAHSGSQRSMTPGQVQSLPHRDQPGPGGQQVAEQVASAAGGHGVGIGGQCARGSARVVGASGRPARAATTAARSDQQRVAGRVEPGAEHDLAVVREQSVAQRGHPRSPRTDAQGAGPLRLAGPAQCPVQGVGDGPGRGRHGGEQLVGVVVAEQRGHGVVVLTGQPVAAAAGDDVHGVADVEQRRRRRRRRLRGGGRPARRRPARAARSCRAARRGPP